MVITGDMLEERINKTIVGRNPEAEMFRKQFDRVLEGGMGLTLVSGRPGIGKSFFVEHAAGMFTGGSATYVHGKFRQYDKGTLVAFSEIIEQTVRYILTLPNEALKNIKSELNRKLGSDSGIILSICPYAGILFETHKAVRTDNFEQLKYRVRKAVYQFLTTVSTALFPLIIFIDDLQWADTLSVNIIETICQDYEFLNLHLVLAWRDDEHGKAYLNPAKLPESDCIWIKLGGLAYDEIDKYIRLVFEQDIEHRDYFIRMLYGLTLGIPFNISRVLRLFIQENVLEYSAASEKWLVRRDKMEKLNLPPDIEQLLTRQIDALTKEDKELLHLIACCQGASTLLLQVLTSEDESLLKGRLEGLCKDALLVKTISDDTASYSYAHDIVLKLAYSHMGPSEKSRLHYRIAETLAELKNGTTSAGGGHDIAAQLLRADLPLLAGRKKEQWINELFTAGVRAKQGAAAEQALELFERCNRLLTGDRPQGKGNFDLSLRLELAECRYICGQGSEAKKDFEALLSEYPETETQIRIKRKYITLCAMSGDFEKVLELGASVLAHLNLKLDAAHTILDLLTTRLLLTDKKISRMKAAPEISDGRLLIILETLTDMAPSANRLSDKTDARIALKLAALSARHGNSDYAPVAYATYTYVLFQLIKDHKRGKKLLEVTLPLIDRCENAASKSAAYCILGAFAHHWANPLEDTAECLARSIEEGERAGPTLYGSYAIAFTILTKYMMGRPLHELRQYIDDCRRKQNRPEHYLSAQIYDIYENHILALCGSAPAEEAASPDGAYPYKELFADTITINRDIIELERLYLEGEMTEAWRLAEAIQPKDVGLHGGFVINVEFLFYSALARLAAHKDLSETEKQGNKRVTEKHLRALKYTVSRYPVNHSARYLLVQAEYDALFKPKKAADRLYREAMAFAEKQGNLSLEALANLLAAKFHRADPRLSGFYAAEAIRLYQKWGAARIAGLIAGDMGLSDEAACTSETSDQPAAINESERDILFHLGETEKLTGDEGYLYLLELLIRREDADYCAVFVEKADEMYLKYEKRKGSDARTHGNPINMNYLSALPHRMIRYVARTETELLTDTRAASGIFAGDPYLKDKAGLSFLCLPVKYSGVLIGILYMEKTGEFGDSLPAFIKGFLPSLLSRQTTIRETDIQGILNPQSENSLFTERELEILGLLAQGLSNADIGEELHITLGTVKSHLRNIYAKLETDNRVKAVMRAKELNIIQA
ncbi:MAG: AAA family ATPase [Clostridiaceae bacterium]|nr:AAA family ATPase [Clostridiaceae bacterium]